MRTCKASDVDAVRVIDLIANHLWLFTKSSYTYHNTAQVYLVLMIVDVYILHKLT